MSLRMIMNRRNFIKLLGGATVVGLSGVSIARSSGDLSGGCIYRLSRLKDNPVSFINTSNVPGGDG